MEAAWRSRSKAPGALHTSPSRTPTTPCVNLLLVHKAFRASNQGKGFPGGSVVKNPPARAEATGDSGLIAGLGRSSRGGNDNPLQYSWQDNAMDRRAWWATVRGVTREVRRD